MTIEGIRNHAFFTISSPPSSLPDDALSQTPIFCRKTSLDTVQSIQLQTISENETLNATQNDENIDDQDVIMTSDSTYQQTDSPFITKFLNYSEKYGLGYVISNGYIGVYFNDNTSMIANSCKKVYYISKDKAVSEGTFEFFRAHSKDLDKKSRLLEYFAEKLQVRLSVKEISTTEPPEFIFLLKWAVSKYDISFKLSNGCVQSIFPDHTRLMVDRYGRGLYVDEKQREYRFDIQNLQPDLEPLQKRVDHLKKLVAYYNK